MRFNTVSQKRPDQSSCEKNRPLPSSKNPHFQNEARCTTFLVKMSFICLRMKNDFHIKGWAPTLVLKQRPGELENGLLVRTLHRYFGGHSSNLRKPEFFRLSFRTYISCVFNCHDPHLFLYPSVQIYEIHIFIIYFSLLLFSQASNTPLPTPTLLTRYAGLSFYVLSALWLLSRLKIEK